MSDYLWNKTGAPDEEIEALEESLRPLRYRHQDLELPARAEIGRHRRAVLHVCLSSSEHSRFSRTRNFPSPANIFASACVLNNERRKARGQKQ